MGTAGQAEIDFRFGTLVQTADRLMAYKYIVKNVCHNLGYTATFMPKPLFGDNGSGMHVPPVALEGRQPALLRRERLRPPVRRRHGWYIGGLIAHAPALLRPLRSDHQQLPPPGARASRRRST